MARTHRPRRLAAGVLALAALIFFTGCATEYPNTPFNHTSDFNTEVDGLFDRLFFLGTLVFIGVEAALLYVVFRFRRREGQTEPRHVHGNTTLEILWTAIPAVILVFIAIPTVRSIFHTQAKARADALQVEVIGHQWWWEFRYPQYTTTNPQTGKVDTLVTANELYLPTGRTVNFALKTADVLHSFWVPRLGGTRDLISNHTNYLWFTPVDSMGDKVLNGFCKEYCGASHANMRFRTFTVSPDKFAQWTAAQLAPAVLHAGAPAGAPAGATPGTVPATTAAGTATATPVLATAAVAGQPAGGTRVGDTTSGPLGQARAREEGAPNNAQVATGATGGQGFAYLDSLPQYAIPTQPLPKDVAFPANLVGDATRGQQAFMAGGCIGCHMIRGNPAAMGRIGPNLTHIGTRYTIASSQFPNEPAYMARWIKNAPKMKPGSLMPTLGKGETNPITGQKMNFGLTDQQIADVVAYLQALK